MNIRLVIIGNGFDLQAGLKSSFDDFFKKSEFQIIENWISFPGTANIEDVNFISLLLYNTFYRSDDTYQDKRLNIHFCEFQKEFKSAFGFSKNPVDWMDVESFLHALLVSKGITKMSECFERVINHKSISDNFCICHKDFILDFFSNSPSSKYSSCADDFYKFLFLELRRFEMRFTKYLSSEIEDNDAYLNKSNKIYNQLVENGDIVKIINFNYTNILKKNSSDEINVHGTLGTDIIIGINDDNDLDEKSIQFTKTFRKLVSKESVNTLNNTIGEILIYGHSLGKQDYAYFQSIFDHYNLYT